ncbi:MAG: hypothetical protein ACTSRC_07360 [Candidatus Helarchaeota archaeon]
MELELRHFYPLILFVVPTIIITIVLFIIEPPSITMIIGFIVLLVAACGTYYMGIKGVLKESD